MFHTKGSMKKEMLGKCAFDSVQALFTLLWYFQQNKFLNHHATLSTFFIGKCWFMNISRMLLRALLEGGSEAFSSGSPAEIRALRSHVRSLPKVSALLIVNENKQHVRFLLSCGIFNIWCVLSVFNGENIRSYFKTFFLFWASERNNCISSGT